MNSLADIPSEYHCHRRFYQCIWGEISNQHRQDMNGSLATTLKDFGPTNHTENLWSVIKRTLRYIYRDLSFNLNDLALILRELENRYNNLDLFYNVDSYLKIRDCSRLVW